MDNLSQYYKDMSNSEDYYSELPTFDEVSAREEALNNLPPGATQVNVGYDPRPFQQKIHSALKRFNVLVCHRRFGKTVLSIMEMVDQGLVNEHFNPQYAYIAPTYAQAKRVAWEYLIQFTRKIPGAVVNRSELTVSIPRPDRGDKIKFMLLGADNPDSLRGIYLDGVVLDEYAQCHPMIWGEIIRPALSDRKGWAIFIGTPKGENHFFQLYRQAQKLQADGENWYAASFKASETGVLDAEELRDARATMTDEEFEQEYECSFTAALIGSYYGKYIRELEKKGRIKDFDYEPNIPVRTYWDLGIRDATSIWFVQQVGNETRVIDYYESSGVGLDHYIKVIKDKPYLYEYTGHGIPHDGAAKELGSGKTRQETMRELGLLTHIIPRQSIADGIHAARMILQSNIWFHAKNTARGLECLKNYQKKWDAKNAVFLDTPLHNWSSNGADAFRMLSLDLERPGTGIQDKRLVQFRKAVQDYNEVDY